MTKEADITEKFWKALKADRTLMLGLANSDSDAQPMTALLDDEGESGRLWIFSAQNVDLVQELAPNHDAVAQFASKGHSVFAALHGRLTIDNDPVMIDKLWSPFVAAWYKGGKTDPELRLLRFDLDHARIWLNENSIFASVKLLFGADPKKEYKDKVADVPL